MSPRLESFVSPFLVSAGGLGLPYLVFLALGGCHDATSCTAAGFVWGPILVVAVVITGFLAGRLSRSTPVGLLASLMACALVVGSFVITDPRDADATLGRRDWGTVFQSWLAFTGLAFGAMLPGFMLGRTRRDRAEVARLVTQRAAGSISAAEFHQAAGRHGWVDPADQAPPNHRCGRCGKPLSPAWRRKCLHCGASYAEYPPVPRDTSLLD